MRSLLITLMLMFAVPALAADGDVLSGGCADGRGDLECHSYLICDSDTTAGTCTEFDLGQGKDEGYPSYFVVSLLHETGCTAGAIEVQVRGSHVSDTDEIDLLGFNLQTDGVQSHAFNTNFRFVDVVLSGSFTSCTDIDVAIVVFNAR